MEKFQMEKDNSNFFTTNVFSHRQEPRGTPGERRRQRTGESVNLTTVGDYRRSLWSGNEMTVLFGIGYR